MPPRFHKLTLDEFDKLLQRFKFTRRIDSVHLHHTWRPNHAQFNGEKSIESMWLYHTKKNNWSDIAQHLSIDPHGGIWTGRDWNAPPASARGFNGNSQCGPFMIEMIGDFDLGCDELKGEQRSAVIGVIARLQAKHALPPESLRFHNFMTPDKSCPGTAVDYDTLLKEVRDTGAALQATRGPSGEVQWGPREAVVEDVRISRLLTEWNSSRAAHGAAPDGADAEPDETEMSPEEERMISGVEGISLLAPGARGGGDGKDLTPEMLSELRPHLINLNQGEFSDEGLFRTSRADVDAIFEDHLERALSLAQANNRPLSLLFWSHGGLISEKAGLWIAHLQVAWWKKNHVYPIHFVWETGFTDALKQILSGAREAAAARGVRDFWDHTTDPAIEALARAMGGVKIWGAMKESARLASQPGGGAEYAAGKLAEFCAKHQEKVQLHAVGHSAGAIFHSWFLPKAFEKGVPPFETLALLAPAVRVDQFKARLLPFVGDQIKHLAMFTMKRDWEENDNVARIYRKSLLYLIYYALEPRRKEPILGLEISAREDDKVARAFGLKGVPSKVAEAVWAKTLTELKRNASTSATHGGFDNDRATMNSVLRRIINHDDIVDFPEEAVQRGIRGTIWDLPPEMPPEFDRLFPCLPPVTGWGQPGVNRPEGAGAPKTDTAPPVGGDKVALCIGINKYPTAPLHGCVSDARSWGAHFEGKGYQVRYLLDESATRAAIQGALEELVTNRKAGDSVLFQYAGHGTELEDVSGDEQNQGTNGPKDEALCPHDFDTGAFLIDDDIAEIFAKVPAGVSVTCFIDCCHSGTITRFMVGAAAGSAIEMLLPRFLTATPDLIDKHRKFRQGLGKRGFYSRGTPESMRQVVFSACLDREVAYESNGQGEFTVRALQVLKGGLGTGTNGDFIRRVVMAFGAGARQHPQLDCSPAMRDARFVL